MIVARATCIPYIGRRWVVKCERCRIDLPGRHCTRADAEAAGAEHVGLRHERVGVAG